MKNLMAAALITVLSICTFAYRDTVWETTEVKAFTCQMHGHGITDVTHAFLEFGNTSSKSTGKHIAKRVSFSVEASYDRTYAVNGPQVITELIGSITRIDQFAGSALTSNSTIDGMPEPTEFNIVDKDRQLDAIITAVFKRTSNNSGNLVLTYQNYDDASKFFKFSGLCNAK